MRIDRARRWSLPTLGVLVAATLLTVTEAQAAPGDLTFTGCIGGNTAPACVDPDPDVLGGAAGAAVSPDGRNVYVASGSFGALLTFDRTAQGGLTFARCVSDDGFGGCEDPWQDPLWGALDVAVAPDGEDVYLVTDSDDSIAHFRRDAAGVVEYGGCIADEGDHGCTNPAQDAMASAEALAISPDGEDIYVTASIDNAINHFNRNPDGSITYGGCIATDGQNSCTNPPLDSLRGASDVAVSPDGANVYVVSRTDDSITRFTRDEFGGLTFAECIAALGDNGCVESGGGWALMSPTGVGVSPDGKSVYVTASFEDSVTHFTVGAGGSLAFAGCIANEDGCTPPPGDSLAGVRDPVVSPDNASVYATSDLSWAVTHFARGADGGLTFANCVADDADSGCAVPSEPVLQGAHASVLSPDGLQLYVTAGSDSAISTFAREPLPPPDTTPPETEITKGPKKKLKTAKKKVKAKFAFASSEPGSTFECRVDKKDFKPCGSPLKQKLKRGKRRFEVRAVDAAGNVDPTPAKRKVKVKRKRKR